MKIIHFTFIILLSLFVTSCGTVQVSTDYDRSTNWGYGPYGYYGGYYGGNSVSSYQAGTIVIDIIDDKRNILVWQGVGSDLNLSNISAKAERIPKAIEEILAKFPPQPKK